MSTLDLLKISSVTETRTKPTVSSPLTREQNPLHTAMFSDSDAHHEIGTRDMGLRWQCWQIMWQSMLHNRNSPSPQTSFIECWMRGWNLTCTYCAPLSLTQANLNDEVNPKKLLDTQGSNKADHNQINLGIKKRIIGLEFREEESKNNGIKWFRQQTIPTS